jgi:NAD(P)-dependent dehydrogenase (short-subunit alcohol dehydrogenase family)
MMFYLYLQTLPAGNPKLPFSKKASPPSCLEIPLLKALWEQKLTSSCQIAFAWHREITLLAANAGIRSNSAAMRTPDEGDVPKKPSLKVLDVNINGPVYGIKLFVHYIQKHNPAVPEDGSAKASVIITASQGGFYPLPLDAIYCASKHAVFPPPLINVLYAAISESD